MPTVIVRPPTEAEVETLKGAATGELHLLAFLDERVTVVVRGPTRAEFRKWKDAASNKQGDARLKASELLAQACVVYPAQAELNAVTEAYPGLWESIAGELMDIAGVMQASSKKVL